ncbi:hypothetical protein FB446DRAFT_827511 [Lentinula raphanica]|nr:hypothetical protein FB446DRAFT_827511 [Lentinula raphanica]
MSTPNVAHADGTSDGINLETASNSLNSRTLSATSTIISPGTDSNGELMPQELFSARLATYTTKAPLLATCIELNITGVKTANLERLRSKILGYWYPNSPEGSQSSISKRRKSLAIDQHSPRLTSSWVPTGGHGVGTHLLGWYNRDVYHTNYAPQIPKDAVLAAHGWKEHETCDAVYRRASVPPQFLSLVVPQADEILAQVRQAQQSQDNLRGCENFWQMIINYRTIFFQTSAAIYEIVPKSAIFRLPALCNPDVINWMKNGFPSEYAALKAQAGSPVDLTRIQDRMISKTYNLPLIDANTLPSLAKIDIQKPSVTLLTTQPSSTPSAQVIPFMPPYANPHTTPSLNPRTPPRSTAHTPPNMTAHTPPCLTSRTPPHLTPRTLPNTTPRTLPNTTPYTPPNTTPRTLPNTTPYTPPNMTPHTPPNMTPRTPPNTTPCTPPNTTPCTPPNMTPCTPPDSTDSLHASVHGHTTPLAVHVGVYQSPDRSMRAFVDPTVTSAKSSVDLVLPPIQAFHAPGVLPTAWPPVFGTKALSWDQVFELIQQFDSLWDVWRPNFTLDKYTDIASVWRCYNSGEKTINTRTNTETGIKPPLRLVEQWFGARWRPGPKARKQWQRFLAIPDYISTELAKGRNEKAVLEELEQMRNIAGNKWKCGLNQLAIRLEEQRKSIQIPSLPITDNAAPDETSAEKKITRKPAVNRRPKPKKN